MRTPARLAAAAACVLTAVALIAGCGGGDDNAVDATEGLGPAEILRASADAGAKLRSFRLEFTVTGRADLGAGASRLVGDDIDLAGEGVVSPPDEALSLDATVGVAGLPVQANLTRVGDVVALDALGRTVGIEVSPTVLAYLDLGAAYPELTTWLRRPATGERKDIGGTPTVAVSGPIDPARVAAAAAPLAGDTAAAHAAAGDLGGTATIWIGTADLLPRRIEVTVAGDAAGVTSGAGPVDITATVDLGDFDAPVDIPTPTPDTRMPLDRLGSLIGG